MYSGLSRSCLAAERELRLAVGIAARCDQLEVVGVNALGDRDVRVDKRPQAKFFDPNEFCLLWSQ